MAVDSILTISETGMDFQRKRLEAIAANIANANTTRSASGELYQPIDVVATSGLQPLLGPFDAALHSQMDVGSLNGIESMELLERPVESKLLFDPNHPSANAQGFVELPNIDPVVEMTNLVAATRAYEANVRVMNAAKAMAIKALELGK